MEPRYVVGVLLETGAYADVAEAYPHLTDEQIRACVEYVQTHPEVMVDP